MKYFIWVLGCTMNYSDAERIATVLDLLGYTKTENENEADLIITVACSVRQKAIDRIYGKCKSWEKLKSKDSSKKIILTGCVLKSDREKLSKTFDLIFDISNITDLTNFLNIFSNKNKKLHLDKDDPEKANLSDYLSIWPTHESDFRAFVPIMTGCNNFCSYCAVPYTRGREKSRTPKEIIVEVKGLIKSGYKEIHLLGQNVNSYKYDFGKLLIKLDKIVGEWRGYFYSNHPKDFSDVLLETISKLKHFPPYIHLPLQSGSDRILKEMNRGYNQEKYLDLVRKIRKTIPSVSLTTDIIVGYPGETKKDFLETLKIVRQVGFEMIYIGQYSPRPGTKSAKTKDDVSKDEKLKRDQEVTNILAEYLEKRNKKYFGKKIKALMDEKKGQKYYGRTSDYKVVEIKLSNPKTKEPKIGDFTEVLIEDTGPWKLFGTTDF